MRNKYLKKGIIISGLCLLIGAIVFIDVLNRPSQEIAKTDNPNKDARSSLANMFSNKQLRFISNQGQAGTDANFHVQGAGHTVLFDEDKVTLLRLESATKKNEIVLQFEGANQEPAIKGLEKLPGVAHYYKGNEPAKWHTNVPTYGSVIYKDLYPGIDMAYIGDDGILESEFYVSSGVDYHQIKLDYKGIISKKIENDGSLLLETELGGLVEKAPIAYQEIDGLRTKVDAEYILLADANISFELGNYNEEYPVVIDPGLTFITIISSITGTWFEDVVFDSNGDIVLAGAADRFFNANNVIDGSNHEGGLGNDGLLVKLDGTTGEVIYSALFGGSKTDYFTGIETDQSDNIFLSGLTTSTDLPVLNADQNTSGGDHDAFFTKINTSGQIAYSTYLGGSARDWGEGIALDESGNVYVGGRTKSDDFPVLGAFQQQNNGGEWDMFVTKYNPDGNKIFSTYLGGSENDRFTGIAVTTSEMATITGVTESPDFPLQNAYQGTFGGGAFGEGDAIVSRFNTAGNELVYSTFLGGDRADWAYDIEIGANGNAFIAGGTSSDNFPVVNGSSNPESGVADGIVARFDNDGQPVYSLRTNRQGYESFDALAVNDSNTIFPVTSGDTVTFFIKSDENFLIPYFKVEEEGYNVNAINLANNNLAFAGTYFPPENPLLEKNVQSQNSGHKASSVRSDPNAFGANIFGWNFTELFLIVFSGKIGGDHSIISVANTESVDVYIDNLVVADDLILDSPEVVSLPLNNTTVLVEITEADAPDNSNPLSSFVVDIVNGEGQDAYLPNKSAFLFYEYETESFKLLHKKDLKSQSDDPLKSELFIAQVAPDLGAIDLQQVDENDPPNVLETLFNDIQPDSVTDYVSINSDYFFTQITNTDNSQQYGLTDFNLSDYAGEALIGAVVSGVEPLTGNLLLFDTDGNVIVDLVTSLDERNSIAGELKTNYPNPLTEYTIIPYILSEDSHVILKVYNSSGQLVRTLINEQQKQGKSSLTFDATDLSHGIYYYSLEVNGRRSVKKMVKN